MSDEQKRPSLSDERFANWCVDSFEDQKDRYHAFVGEQSRWIDVLESRLRVSEAEHQAKIKEMQEEFNSYCAKTQANCNHCAVKHTEKIEALEGENAKLRERLEAIRKHYEKLPTWKEARQKSTATNKVEEEQIPAHLILIDMWNAWARERGVLLSEPTFLPKKLDQKTEYEKCKFNPKDDCNDCEFEGCPNWGASLEEQDIEKSEPKELDQKTREGDPK